MNSITEVSQARKYTSADIAPFLRPLREEYSDDYQPALRAALKTLLETSMEVQVQDLVGARLWEHNEQRAGWRNGYYRRNLLSGVGYIEGLRVPRVRSGGIGSAVLERYARRLPEVDALVRDMFLAGVSTRRVKEVLVPLLGPQPLSVATVSNITKALDAQVKAYHNRRFADDWQYLLLDGVYLNAKSPLHSKRRCVLVAYGINASGKRELLDFMLSPGGESQIAWECFLSRLYYRGLEGAQLTLTVIDGNKGLENAVRTVYPFAKIQRCWAHKLRNAAQHLPRKQQKPCSAQARYIYAAEDKTGALKALRKWSDTWRVISPRAVECVERDAEELLAVFDCPAVMRIKLRTTNAIERVFREVRRRTRPMSCFTNKASVERIMFAIFNRQNKLWEEKPLLKITHNY